MGKARSRDLYYIYYMMTTEMKVRTQFKNIKVFF
jgi:hypothetical protein